MTRAEQDTIEVKSQVHPRRSKRDSFLLFEMTLLNRLHPWTRPVTQFISSSRRSTCIINLPSAQLHHHTHTLSNFNTAKQTSHNPRRKCVRWSGSSSRNDDVLYTTEDQRKKDHRHCVEMVQTRDFEGYCKSNNI